MLVGVGGEADVGGDVREEAGFGIWPEVGVLAEAEADGWTQGGGF